MGKSISKATVGDFCRKLCGEYRLRNYSDTQRNHKATNDAGSTFTNDKNKEDALCDVDLFIDEEYFTKEDITYYSKLYADEKIESNSMPSEMK